MDTKEHSQKEVKVAGTLKSSEDAQLWRKPF
jgi:hypothetical protein